MLIRSQDKQDLVCFKNIIHLGLTNTSIYVHFVNGSYLALGRYSTKEKAIKVLDMIVDGWENQSKKFKFVFEMPQDEEVKEC